MSDLQRYSLNLKLNKNKDDIVVFFCLKSVQCCIVSAVQMHMSTGRKTTDEIRNLKKRQTLIVVQVKLFRTLLLIEHVPLFRTPLLIGHFPLFRTPL